MQIEQYQSYRKRTFCLKMSFHIIVPSKSRQLIQNKSLRTFTTIFKTGSFWRQDTTKTVGDGSFWRQDTTRTVGDGSLWRQDTTSTVGDGSLRLQTAQPNTWNQQQCKNFKQNISICGNLVRQYLTISFKILERQFSGFAF